MINRKFIRLFTLLASMIIGFAGNIDAQVWNPGHRTGTLNGVYNYAYNQVPSQLVEIFAAAAPNTGLTYEWEQSTSPLMTSPVIVGTSSSYTFSAPLTQTTYFRRKSKVTSVNYIYSNIIKISVVSINWEDINYVREHDVTVSGVTTWQAVDQLAVGPKSQTTIYLDGIGRNTQKVIRETATPSSGTLWGDMVQFYQYDQYGRQPVKYLSYTTTSQSGKYKTSPITEQSQYFTNNYNESSPFFSTIFDNSPLDRVSSVKQPGTAWAAASGITANYDVNSATDNVRIFTIDYVQGSAPVTTATFPANTLYKSTSTDENGNKVVEFSNKAGQLILKKVQIDPTPASAYSGWICTYSIYDDKGLLRCQIEPEGVKYLDANGWTFAGTTGTQVLNEQCFLYDYDAKGRIIWKKTPGADPMRMIYDYRDRLVFMQDGNQAAITPTPQWTVNLYDELDRQIITALYTTSKTVSALQTDINNSITSSSVTVNNTAQAITDLVLNNRQSGITSYQARNSIEFVTDANGSFESLPGDDFTAEINPAATQSSVVTTATYNNPVITADLNNPAITTILKYAFYDNYSFDGAKPFNNSFTNLSAYSSSDPDVLPIVPSKRTISASTGSKVRVLGSNTFLSSTRYYDERGQIIQVLEDNIKSGTDVTTMQYHFDGRRISTCTDHSTPATSLGNFKTLTKYIFDKLGRITSIQKQFGNNPFKTISAYDFDDMGRIKVKHLDPGYTAGGNSELESLAYTYNLHNQLTGINKDYAQKNPGNYNKWQHFFGLYIGFDNRDNVFTTANLNGQVAGMLWNTQGDDAQRRYDFNYDNAGRLTNAAFKEQKHPGDGWSAAAMDFSVTGNSGYITYDLNGNLINLLHKGVIPGNASPVTIDNLTYAYNGNSNKLQTVTDGMTSTAVNGMFDDFKDGTNGSTPDYVYDNNGNLIVDLNKNVQSLNGGAAGTKGISYNYLDKPELIRIVGKGTIKIIYSADGDKLQRAFIPENGSPASITTYINGFIYQETATITTSTPAPLGGAASLSFISFEEGRIRVINPTNQNNGLDILTVDGNMDLPGGKRGAYDYFVTDYQQNVRMILTEEIHVAANTATMETTRSTLEESIFGQTGGANEVQTTRFPTPTSSWINGSLGANVSRLGTVSGHNVGPNTLQKVMAGDKVTASVQYFYQSAAGGNNTNFVSAVINSLLPSITGGTAVNNLVKNNASTITTQLSGVQGFINAVQPGGSNPPGNTPQAYLTILFFDERFNFIAAADGGVAQQQVAASVGSAGLSLNLPNVKAPKNGYAYIYISNQSNQDVYFDNLNVNINAGNIIEENHYYSYGLKIAGISSKKSGDSYEGVLKSNYLYQGAFSELDEDAGWHDFALRNYDAQIGRWIQQDPYQQFTSPYSGMACEPINNIDPTGGIIEKGIFEGMSELGRSAVMTLFGAMVGGAVDAITGGEGGKGLIYGAAAGLSASVLGSFDWGYLIVGSSASLNFFVTQSPEVRKSDHGGLGALNADLAWAKTKRFFSFGRLKIISEANGKDAAKKISEICESRGKSIGTIILESHAHSEVEGAYGEGDDAVCRSYDPATTSLGLGGDDMNSRVNAKTDLNTVDFFKDLQPFTNSNTKVFLGNCWSGHPAFQPVMKQISQIWNNATVYGHAAECRTSSLFFRNTFFSRSYAGSGDAKAFTKGFHPRVPGSKARASCLVRYDEIGNNGKFFKAQGGQVTPANTVYFGKGASITEIKFP